MSAVITRMPCSSAPISRRANASGFPAQSISTSGFCRSKPSGCVKTKRLGQVDRASLAGVADHRADQLESLGLAQDVGGHADADRAQAQEADAQRSQRQRDRLGDGGRGRCADQGVPGGGTAADEETQAARLRERRSAFFCRMAPSSSKRIGKTDRRKTPRRRPMRWPDPIRTSRAHLSASGTRRPGARPRTGRSNRNRPDPTRTAGRHRDGRRSRARPRRGASRRCVHARHRRRARRGRRRAGGRGCASPKRAASSALAGMPALAKASFKSATDSASPVASKLGGRLFIRAAPTDAWLRRVAIGRSCCRSRKRPRPRACPRATSGRSRAPRWPGVRAKPDTELPNFKTWVGDSLTPAPPRRIPAAPFPGRR